MMDRRQKARRECDQDRWIINLMVALVAIALGILIGRA
jgi:hypothetical protein